MNKTLKKICVVTGTRAEYGLLSSLLRELKADKQIELQIVATGMHLSPEFGMTVKEIEEDGFQINKNIEILLSSDTSVGVCKSMGLGMISFAEIFQELLPEVIIVLGDRFEIFAAVSTALISQIPVAHIHGGELTEGAFDDSIRHSITKMSHIHFVATEEYRRRVIQLGEEPGMVFNVGALGIDNIKNSNLFNKEQLEDSINFKLGKKNILVTFHPVTLENNNSINQFKELLKALGELEDTHIIFTKANADTNGRSLNAMVDSFVDKNPDTSVAFTSLGKIRYLSTLQFIDGVVGNSSSGLIEAPSFHIGTINIGNRQKGRIKADSVIDCEADYKSIKKSLEKLYSEDFSKLLLDVKNPYGNGGASVKIANHIKNISYENILNKKFNDIHV